MDRADLVDYGRHNKTAVCKPPLLVLQATRLVAEIRRRFDVLVAEVGHVELHRRALVRAAIVAADRECVVEKLDAVEKFAAARPEFELLSARRSVRNSDD